MLYKRGADIILSGHAHRYERYAPVTPRGKHSARGIRQFIVGTGRAPGAQKGPIFLARMRAKKIGTPGVLKLRLGSGSYRWKFAPRRAGPSPTRAGTGATNSSLPRG